MGEDYDYVEITVELAAQLAAADSRIDDLHNQLRIAESAKQELLNSAVASKAQFKVGDDVIARGSRSRYRVTKVLGEHWQVGKMKPLIQLKYYGQRVKVDGSLHNEREKWIWNLKPIDAPERNEVNG